MKDKLIKISGAVGLLVSSWYWGAAGVFAAGPLCPTTGIKPPGCEATAVSLDKIVGSIINIILFLAFVAALVYLVIGGIKWIMSGGDKEGTGKAKEAVTSALLGLAVVVASYLLINIILGFFGADGGLTNLTFPKLQY